MARRIFWLCAGVSGETAGVCQFSSRDSGAEARYVTGEIRDFSPDAVVGGYAKTKAEATREVLRAAQEGLDAVVVHPSGILGPYDRSGNHLCRWSRSICTERSGLCKRRI